MTPAGFEEGRGRGTVRGRGRDVTSGSEESGNY